MAATSSRGGSTTFDLNQTTLIVNNVALNGFGDSDVMAIARNSDDYSQTVGADGEVVQSALNDRSGTITISLLYGSRHNATLMDLVKADRANNGGFTNLDWTDKRGLSTVSARGRVMRVPDYTIGREAGVLEWAFLCPDIDADWQGLPQD